MNLCEYGCGKEATHQFKNGKWCCSSHASKCEIYKKILKNKFIGNLNPFYGKTHTNENKKIISEKGKNRKSWNTGKTYNLKKENLEKRRIKVNNIKSIELCNKHILCDYGCGKKALYQLNNKKYCCEKNFHSCSFIKEKVSNSNKGKIQWNKGIKNCFSESWKEQQSIRVKGKKLKKHSEETIMKNKISHRSPIEYIKKKYPLFSKIEEMRYNPDKPEEFEIQVHCKNHNCNNSKEKDGWFTPTKEQRYYRIRSLERFGNDNDYFYCSDKCKNECPLYRSHGIDLYKSSEVYYTSEEYETFRQEVLKRDNYVCQYCENKAEHVHHERPQKLEPFFSLDPDYGISVCKECHYKYGHKDECSTGKLANKQCLKDNI